MYRAHVKGSGRHKKWLKYSVIPFWKSATPSSFSVRSAVHLKILGLLVSSWLAEGQNQWPHNWRWGRALDSQQHWKEEGWAADTACVGGEWSWPQKGKGSLLPQRWTDREKRRSWCQRGFEVGWWGSQDVPPVNGVCNRLGVSSLPLKCSWLGGKMRVMVLIFCPDKWNTWIIEGIVSDWGFFFF